MENNQNNQNNQVIPDLEKLTNDILKFIEFIDRPETKEIKDVNKSQFNFLVNEQFPELPRSMIKLLSDYENRHNNLKKIIDMITLLNSIKTGEKTLQTAENEFVEKRAEEYLYPAFGGKDNFYKVAEENRIKQEQEKKNKKKGHSI